MTNSEMGVDPAYEGVADEELARRCGEGIEAAERELLRRHMQAIYWLPKRAFGADEEDLSDFLLFALEKIRARDILAKYDPDRGARFSTWLSVVLRRLYLDYLRALPEEPTTGELVEEAFAARPESAETARPPSLLDRMQVRCRALFKLLLCDSFYLAPEEVRWIAETSGQEVLEVARRVAEMEEELREREAKIAQRYDRLATVYWWTTKQEKRLAAMERELVNANDETRGRYETVLERLRKRRAEYDRLQEELAGGAGLATVPYKDLAALLNLKEGTLASHISRCRGKAAEALLQDRQGAAGEGETP